MPIKIEIEPQTLTLLQLVREKGVSLDSILRAALEKFDDEESFQLSVPAEEWIESFQKWANEPRDLPNLSDESLRRESIYEDRI